MNKITYIIILIVIMLICIIYIQIDKQKLKKKRAKEDNLDQTEKMKDIEELKEKFKYELVGHWISCQGTFNSIMNEEWIFRSDGTGLIIRRSLSTGEEKEEFNWRRNGIYCIDIKETESNWIAKYYDFCLVPTDCGYYPALVELDNEKNAMKGFGLYEVPLSYHGEVA